MGAVVDSQDHRHASFPSLLHFVQLLFEKVVLNSRHAPVRSGAALFCRLRQLEALYICDCSLSPGKKKSPRGAECTELDYAAPLQPETSKHHAVARTFQYQGAGCAGLRAGGVGVGSLVPFSGGIFVTTL